MSRERAVYKKPNRREYGLLPPLMRVIHRISGELIGRVERAECERRSVNENGSVSGS